MITRARAQAGDLSAALTDLGATVLPLPTIAIADPASFDDLDSALGEAASGSYEWIVFLSVNAVEQVAKRLAALSLDPLAVCGSRVVAVGKATARALTDKGISVDLFPSTFTAEGVAEVLGDGQGMVLVPRAEDAPVESLDRLRSRGWRVNEVVAYRTVLVAEGPGRDLLKKRRFDVVTFTSGSTARGLASMVSPAQAGLSPEDPDARKVVCIGPVTAAVAKDLGFRVDAIAAEHSTEGLVATLVKLWLNPAGQDKDGEMAR